MADIQVNLLDKGDRSAQSHEIASLLRPEIQRIGNKYNANVKIVEVPPGPPVLSTIVGEIYGPDYDTQMEIADQVQQILRSRPSGISVYNRQGKGNALWCGTTTNCPYHEYGPVGKGGDQSIR